ncbi:MAG: ABC-type transport auxiliary lipoprotein family protein [Burkholderiaceae bacterium]|nr:ABC-type transport auxiliary lipoprotein family protein [Burkholderiaceae bacterium]
MRHLLWLAALVASCLLAACVSVGVGNASAPHTYYLLHDTAASATRRAEPLVSALLLQPLPASALAETVSIPYARRANEFAFYQFASWTERPVRMVQRMLRQRLEARGVAAAVGLIGDPLRADWLLTFAIETLHHDVATPPGTARFALTVELFDRRSRTRVARRQFEATAPTANADSAAAADALSQAITRVLDVLPPWLESELQRAGS